MTTPTAGAEEVRRFRFRRHQLVHDPEGGKGNDVALLDYGVQDTGPDGAAWALATPADVDPGCGKLLGEG